MKLRDKRFLKFEALMALAAVVASLTLTIVMDKPIATFSTGSYALFWWFDLMDRTTFEWSAVKDVLLRK